MHRGRTTDKHCTSARPAPPHHPPPPEPHGCCRYQPACESAHGKSAADQVCATIEKMLSLPLYAQNRFLLLTIACQSRMMHFARAVPWAHICDHTRQTEASILVAVNEIMRIPHDDPRSAAQVILPARLGGLGITSTPLAVGDGAYLATATVQHVIL